MTALLLRMGQSRRALMTYRAGTLFLSFIIDDKADKMRFTIYSSIRSIVRRSPAASL